MSLIRQYSYNEFITALFDTNARGHLVSELPAELLNSQWTVNPGNGRAAPFDLVPETVVFTTSGSTGKPRSVRRNKLQITLETELVSALVSHGASSPDEVVSFAPPNHAFGFLCGFALSLRLGIPFTYCPTDAAIPIVGRANISSLLLTLPGSFQTLGRSERAFTSRHRTAIIQSAGPASPKYAATIDALQGTGVEGFEIYGSTEAGAIGHRRTSTTPHAWKLFDDIEVVPHCEVTGAPSEMIVTGPRCVPILDNKGKDVLISNQYSVRTGDVVRFVGDRHFALIGRLDRVIQINGVNTDLDVLQLHLSHHFDDIDFFVEKRLDDLRGHGFVVHFFYRGSRANVEKIQRDITYVLSESYPKNIYPSKVEFSDVPFRRSHSGKVLGLPTGSHPDTRMDVI